MRNLGFTLIELIIVIGILSIISMGAIAVLNPAEQFKKANDAREKADLSQVQKALENYYEDHGTYPSSATGYKIQVPNGAGVKIIEWGSNWQPYMNVVPKSPNGRYVYYSGDGQTYYLYASLERPGDSQACNGGGACSGSSLTDLSTACGGVCNYGVSSPNVSP